MINNNHFIYIPLKLEAIAGNGVEIVRTSLSRFEMVEDGDLVLGLVPSLFSTSDGVVEQKHLKIAGIPEFLAKLISFLI